MADPCGERGQFTGDVGAHLSGRVAQALAHGLHRGGERVREVEGRHTATPVLAALRCRAMYPGFTVGDVERELRVEGVDDASGGVELGRVQQRDLFAERVVDALACADALHGEGDVVQQEGVRNGVEVADACGRVVDRAGDDFEPGAGGSAHPFEGAHDAGGHLDESALDGGGVEGGAVPSAESDALSDQHELVLAVAGEHSVVAQHPAAGGGAVHRS